MLGTPHGRALFTRRGKRCRHALGPQQSRTLSSARFSVSPAPLAATHQRPPPPPAAGAADAVAVGTDQRENSGPLAGPGLGPPAHPAPPRSRPSGPAVRGPRGGASADLARSCSEPRAGPVPRARPPGPTPRARPPGPITDNIKWDIWDVRNRIILFNPITDISYGVSSRPGAAVRRRVSVGCSSARPCRREAGGGGSGGGGGDGDGCHWLVPASSGRVGRKLFTS